MLPVIIGEQILVVKYPQAPQCSGLFEHVLPYNTGDAKHVVPQVIGDVIHVLDCVTPDTQTPVDTVQNLNASS